MEHEDNDRRPAHPAHPARPTGRTWQKPELTRLRADATAAGGFGTPDFSALPGSS